MRISQIERSPEKGSGHLAHFARAELSSESAGNSKARVRVGEELLGVLLDLLESEANASVLAVLDHTSAEWALEAADSVAALLVPDGVGEGNANIKSAFVSSIVHISVLSTYRGGPDLPLTASWMWVAVLAGD
jgi:hypothetical protein